MIPSALHGRGKALVPAMLLSALLFSGCSTSNLRVEQVTPTATTAVIQQPSPTAAPTGAAIATQLVAPTVPPDLTLEATSTTTPTSQAQTTANSTPTAASDLVNGALPNQQAVVQVVDKASPAVVTVINTLDPAVNNGYQGVASGSGAIIDKAGYIVTNNHVVAGAQSLEVIFSDAASSARGRVPAQLVGTDDLNDLAVLKVAGEMPAVAPLGDSDQLKVGETVIAIGSALGEFENSVTVGVVSGLHRNLHDQNTVSLEDAIQTDAAINHGNSGGPLLNLQGQIVGINSAVVRGNGSQQDVAEGLGFSIPVNTVKTISSQLISNGKVSHAYLGIVSELISRQAAAASRIYDDKGQLLDHGAFVIEVGQGTPADKAGVELYDAIMAINGQTIDEEHTLPEVLIKFNPGDTVTLDIIRNRQALQLQVTLGERPAQ